MNEDPLHIVSWSGGKDSKAMVIRMLELKMPVDMLLFAETFWEFPQMYEFHKNFRAWMGKYYPDIPVKTVQTQTTWDHWFHGEVTRGKMKGNKRGWPLAYFPCYWQREAKVKPLEKVCKNNHRYIGYAADEKVRLAGVAMSDPDNGYHSPLGEWGWTEKDCLDYMESKGVAEQIHRDFNRTGCFLCPKQPVKSLEVMCEKYPEQWAQLMAMDEQAPNDFNPKHNLKEIQDRVHDRMLTPPVMRKEAPPEPPCPPCDICSKGIDFLDFEV